MAGTRWWLLGFLVGFVCTFLGGCLGGDECTCFEPPCQCPVKVTPTPTETYDEVSGTWSVAGAMSTARSYAPATLLQSGKVLVAGGYGGEYGTSNLDTAELYDPATRKWTVTGSFPGERSAHTATLLASDEVLVVGGAAAGGATAALYDPLQGTWSSTGSLATERFGGHTATLLHSGKVLVAGGWWRATELLASTELYDPQSGTWSPTGSLAKERTGHMATLLPSGKVLVAGGCVGSSNTAELYDPSSGTWSMTGSLSEGRCQHAAVLLRSGKVVVVGGGTPTIEIYDPASGDWQIGGTFPPELGMGSLSAALLPSGKVLVVGFSNSAYLYDAEVGSWTPTGSLTYARSGNPLTVLQSGQVLVSNQSSQ